jgi:hypothetical protein
MVRRGSGVEWECVCVWGGGIFNFVYGLIALAEDVPDGDDDTDDDAGGGGGGEGGGGN